ncbi:MAG: hypothetical protein QNJ38_11630 [Prochloraceae cyanobacterium]|nr:hypothetical protein [Prochloraceae cyanobacterium]
MEIQGGEKTETITDLKKEIEELKIEFNLINVKLKNKEKSKDAVIDSIVKRLRMVESLAWGLLAMELGLGLALIFYVQ